MRNAKLGARCPEVRLRSYSVAAKYESLAPGKLRKAG
jgi:hypothetical protein